MSEIVSDKTRSTIPGHESRTAFGAFIRRRRRQLNLSQQAVAEHTSTTQASVSAWENGRQFPIDEHFSALAQTLQITEQDLYAAIPKERHTMTKKDTHPISEMSVDDLEFLLSVTKQLPGQKLSWELFIQLLQEKQRPSSEGEKNVDLTR